MEMNIIRPCDRHCPDPCRTDSCCACPSMVAGPTWPTGPAGTITPAAAIAPLPNTASNQDTINKINEILTALRNTGIIAP